MSCKKCKEWEQLFDSHWEAEMRGVKKWRAATGRELTMPGTADFTEWLIVRLEQAELVIEAARALGGIQITNEEPTEDELLILNLACHVAAYEQQKGNS